MRLSVERRVLEDVLAQVAVVVRPKSPLPALAHVLLTAEPAGRLRFAATDLDQTIVRRVEAEVEEPGVLAVPAAELRGFVRRMAAERVTLTGERQLEVRDGRARLRLNTLTEGEYPDLQTTQGEVVAVVGGPVLARMVRLVAPMASREREARPELSGLRLAVVGDRLWAGAADNPGMAVVENRALAAGQGAGEGAVVVPAPALESLVGVLAGEERVRIGRHENLATFVAGETLLSLRRLIGTYPDLERFLAAEGDLRVVVERDALAAAVARLLVVAELPPRGRFVFGRGVLEVQASSDRAGLAEDRLEMEGDGQGRVLWLQLKQLAGALGRLAEGRVQLTIGTPKSPVALRPLDGPDDRAVVLLMPMREG